MLTKIPDYIISDCGYPSWNKETENLQLMKIQTNLWSTSSIWSTKSTNLVKLLPLRETLNDFYLNKLIMMQQKEAPTYRNTTTMTQHCCRNNNSSSNGRQMPKYGNEVIKNVQRKQYEHQQQQQIALDKRRSHRNNSDNDLDQF